ncbi:uncharacterized protein PHACADRAFT_212020 [Phanerochaete carnosa HHB-10118-sp]|uniref:CsbD-like domain-containing protein n=1 Tax=Phanerochaete carnosa (strain HHB-10118-sp) TaxID=650164 RepID=K5USF6_PHACS|nr:uncharacterized protein PHACADRAFT_212020 [Phanerochaete carnosa HHB-10118-sp]EKM52811.1 hypothetical protein PHACADRAFT_212020 [Phanerochaete carnosa HHB-10118-sp]
MGPFVLYSKRRQTIPIIWYQSLLTWLRRGPTLILRSQGGAGVDGGDNLPEGHAKTADKLIGKTQKVAGKMMRKPALHEKGELREAGGKDAAAGRARVPLD